MVFRFGIRPHHHCSLATEDRNLSRTTELLLLSLISTKITKHREGLCIVHRLTSMALRLNNEARVPVIDISEHDTQVADEMPAAVVKWGFAYVRHTGFHAPEIDAMFDIV